MNHLHDYLYILQTQRKETIITHQIRYMWMVLTTIEEQILINQFNNININRQVHMDSAPAMNYVISPFEGNINTGYQQRLRFFLQATKDIYKEYETWYSPRCPLRYHSLVHSEEYDQFMI